MKKLNGLNDFRESVVVAYRDGKYHWTWSCDDANSPNYHVRYGVSDSIDGTITYKGVLLQKDSSKNLQGTAHQSDVHVTDADGNDRCSWPTIATTRRSACSPPASATTVKPPSTRSPSTRTA